jgi:pSer/pThr/pTyr-binding forkhead associated (FHA) protein
MRFPNISGIHCELIFRNGYWYIKDRDSTNGVKVNGVRVQEKLLHPKDEVAIGKRRYTIRYELPADQRALEEVQEEDIMGQSLLERAGLEKSQSGGGAGRNLDEDYLLRED